MSKLVIALGLVMFSVFVIREWSVATTPDNAMLVNSYSSTAIFWLWVAGAGLVYRVLRK